MSNASVFLFRYIYLNMVMCIFLVTAGLPVNLFSIGNLFLFALWYVCCICGRDSL